MIGLNREPPTIKDLQEGFSRLIEKGWVQIYHAPVLTLAGKQVLEELNNQGVLKKLKSIV